MTSPSRRKRRITAHGTSRRPATVCNLAGLALAALLWAGADAPAQQRVRPVHPTYTTSAPGSNGGTPQGSPVRPPRPLPAMPAFQVGTPSYNPALRPVAYQPPGYEATDNDAFDVQLEPPGLERLLSSLQSDEAWKQRLRQENKDKDPTARLVFPEVPVLAREAYPGRGPRWAPHQVVVAPNYVCHGRLLFEQRNAERYGWDLGVLHPAVTAGVFVKDLVTLPYHLGTNPRRKCECSAGLCLPGDPVPLMLYPPGLSLSGTATEVATILALVAIFP